jgi:hypothetical protein
MEIREYCYLQLAHNKHLQNAGFVKDKLFIEVQTRNNLSGTL